MLRFIAQLSCLFLVTLLLNACGPVSNRYALIEDRLRAGDAKGADEIVEQSEKEYGPKSQVQYRMDRGMTLHLAGRYEESNAVLEKADQNVEQLYTRHLSTEAKALLYNDTELPFEGDSYEQVMLNVIKALNYAIEGNLQDALVEARRVDHRLNVLSDQAGDKKDSYRDDALARYLSGVLYEAAGELNDAFIAYRKAFDAYLDSHNWSKTPVPPMLRADLLRVTDALHLTQEHAEYLQSFPDVSWTPYDPQRLAQIVVVSYIGRAPHKEDMFIDLPINLQALNMVLLTKAAIGPNENQREARAAQSVLYGLNGRVVRVAIPRLITQKTQVAYEQVSVSGEGQSYSAVSELMQDLSASAAKSLSDHLTAISVKAVARAAFKFSSAEALGRGARAAGGRDIGPLIGLLVGTVAKSFAAASEEADKRSWRTLPDEIHIARLWVPAGDYKLHVRPIGRGGSQIGREAVQSVTLKNGDTKFVTERVLP